MDRFFALLSAWVVTSFCIVAMFSPELWQRGASVIAAVMWTRLAAALVVTNDGGET